jgi:DNA-binding FrmR family transcriptional regulator
MSAGGGRPLQDWMAEVMCRLRAIEEQVVAVQQLVASGETPPSVTGRIAELQQELDAVAVSLVDRHVRGCLLQPTPHEGAIDAALEAVARRLSR